MLYIFYIVTIGIPAIFFSKIRYEVKKLEYYSGEENKKYNNNYEIIMKVLIFNFIPIYIKKITKEKLVKLLKTSKAKKEEKELIEDTDKIDIKILRNLKYFKELEADIKKFDLKIEIGVEDIILKNSLVILFSTVVAVILAKNVINRNKVHFVVKPTTLDVNKLNVVFSTTIDFKIKNIYKVYKMAKN